MIKKRKKEYHEESAYGFLPVLYAIDLCRFTPIGWQPTATDADGKKKLNQVSCSCEFKSILLKKYII